MKEEITTAIGRSVEQLYGADAATVANVELTRPDEQFGDYATNVALQLAKSVGKSPREIAEAVAAQLRQDDVFEELVVEVTIAGPGFINIRLRDAALMRLGVQHPTQSMAGKTVVTEYSDPNPFKPLHAGHLYTTLVGDTVSRLLEVAGAKVIRINYGGDVGLHAAKAMWSIIHELAGEFPEKLSSVPQDNRAQWLGERYAAGHTAYEDDAQAKAEIVAVNKRIYQLHTTNDRESTFAQIYWECRQWSYDYFETLYKQLQVKPFDRFIPESEVTPLGLKTIKEQLMQGVYSESDGAIVFAGDEQQGLHTRVFINSEGLPTYEAKEVGLSLTKWQDYHFDESLIITANEQQQYMQVVLASIAKFAPESALRTKHLVHGVVKLQGGVKMSSRKGNVVTALQILQAARDAGEETGTNPSEGTILAAVKYAFTKNRIGGDIAYDPKESVALEGNSGPYLQYAHARARSILGKVTDEDAGMGQIEFEAGERSLVRKISEYAEVVDRAVEERMPHHICTYLYELAQSFNRFYEHNLVVGDPRQAVRLELVRRYADTLKAGLELLGIEAPNRM